MSENLLASGSVDHSIKLWDADTYELKSTLTGHTNAVTSVAFSPCGSTVASGSYDHSIKLWDAGTYELKSTLTGHTSGILSIAFSPCGSTIASGSSDSSIKLWDAETGALKSTLQGHTYAVTSVAFSPCGSTIASGSEDCRIKLWDAVTGDLKKTLQGDTKSEFIFSVAFSPRGCTIASGSWDHRIKLWDVGTGALKKTLTGHSGIVWSVAFQPLPIEMAAKALADTIMSTNLQSDVARTVLAFEKIPRVGHRHPNPYPHDELRDLTDQYLGAMEGSDTESKSDAKPGKKRDRDGTGGEYDSKGNDMPATKRPKPTEEPYRNVRKQMCAWCRARSSRLVQTSRRQVWRTREDDRPY
jgi:predicted NACHT family NTPase